MVLVTPSFEHLASYVAALERGWSADNERNALAAREELEQVQANATAFLESMTDREAKAGPVTLPDGSQVSRIPGFRRWLWDGEFCGSIGFRWQLGTTALPPHCLGHIGYAVVPWKQGRGYAKRALSLLLPEAKAEGCPSSKSPPILRTWSRSESSQQTAASLWSTSPSHLSSAASPGCGFALHWNEGA